MPDFRTLALATLFTAAAALSAHADSGKVRIFAPSSARTFFAVTPRPVGEGPPIITVFIQPTNRYLIAQRALFQNWTGFKKQYSGRRYPF